METTNPHPWGGVIIKLGQVVGVLPLALLVAVILGVSSSDDSVAESAGIFTDVEGGVVYSLDEAGSVYTAVANWDGTSSEITIKSCIDYNSKVYSVVGINQFETNSIVTSVTIEPNYSLVLADGTFKYNYELASVTIGEGIQQIPADFCRGTKLSSVTVPSTVMELGTSCFSTCKSLITVVLPTGIIAIPASAFNDCTALTTINLNSIETFGDASFMGCEALNPINLSSVTLIGNYAFKGCHSITNVVLPECLEDVGDESFASCYGLGSVTMSSTPIGFGLKMFFNCDNLTEVTLTDEVKVIGRQMFSDCDALETINLNKVETIDTSAFRGSSILKNVINSDNVKKIGTTAFQDCTSLKDFTFGENLTSISTGAFDNTILETVVIPANLTEVPWHGSGGDIFLFPDTVKSITVSPDNSAFMVKDGIVYKKDMSEAVYCPPAMTGEATIYANVGDYACYKCHLTKVTIVDGVTSIGASAFRGGVGYVKSTLTEIIIPDSVTSIGKNAFSMQGAKKYESSLTSLVLPADLTTLGSGVLSCHPDLQYVVFPNGSFTAEGTSGYKFYESDGTTQITAWKKNTLVSNYAGLRFVLDNGKFCKVDDEQVLFVTTIGDDVSYKAVSKNETYLPEEPTSSNHLVFDGWFLDPEFKSEYDATVGLTSDVSVFAKFSPETHTITYMLDDEIVGEVEKYAYGSEVTVRGVFEKLGYTVSGWSCSGATPVDGTVTVDEEDILFTATSVVNQYTITFDTVGGSAVYSITQDYNSSVISPSVGPSKEGYRFVKWDPVIPSTMPANDVIIKAIWAIVATVNENGKSVVTLDSETSSFIPAAETKEITVEIRENTAVKVENASDLVGKTVVSKVEPISNNTGVSGTAYEFTFTADGTQYNGKIQVTLPYTKEAGKEPVVYYWNGSESTKMNVVSNTETSVTFETDHNSLYVVASETPSKDDGASFLLYFGILMIAGICVSMLVGFNFYRKKA